MDIDLFKARKYLRDRGASGVETIERWSTREAIANMRAEAVENTRRSADERLIDLEGRIKLMLTEKHMALLTQLQEAGGKQAIEGGKIRDLEPVVQVGWVNRRSVNASTIEYELTDEGIAAIKFFSADYE